MAGSCSSCCRRILSAWSAVQSGALARSAVTAGRPPSCPTHEQTPRTQHAARSTQHAADASLFFNRYSIGSSTWGWKVFPLPFLGQVTGTLLLGYMSLSMTIDECTCFPLVMMPAELLLDCTALHCTAPCAGAGIGTGRLLILVPADPRGEGGGSFHSTGSTDSSRQPGDKRHLPSSAAPRLASPPLAPRLSPGLELFMFTWQQQQQQLPELDTCLCRQPLSSSFRRCPYPALRSMKACSARLG